ncbi:MAG TPA: formate dehydrogenase accessory protein FdhE [Burkholderiaceae bacterium]|nr:formate dehydrogenase accessory protein FdhE [Burkholderiaceae bacterium]
MATPIVTDGTTDRAPKAPRVVLPTRADLFGTRADRFSALATGHPMAAYLQLMAEVARAQQAAFGARRAEAVNEEALAASRDYGMPPLSAQAHERSAKWRDDLQDIAGQVRARSASGVAATLERVLALDVPALESLADRVLAGTALDDDAAFVPFAGAALQVYFARLAASLDVASVNHCDVPGICPVCASRPVASIVRIGGEQANLRYLVCSVCATEWNLARIKCTACDTDKGVQYLSLTRDENAKATDAPTRAEVCDECNSYLKIFYQEKDPQVEPNADDLATLALDVLVDEQGYGRSGPNLLLHPGSA